MSNIKKILVVEDTQELRELLGMNLKEAGFEVEVASNGVESLEIMKKAPVDLVLMDIVMPDMNGYEVLAKLNEMRIMTPVIIYSNMPEIESRNEAIKLGAVDYFEKAEIPIEVVIEKIHFYLKRPPEKQKEEDNSI